VESISILTRQLQQRSDAGHHPTHPMLAAAVKLTVVADENLTVGSTVRLPAESLAPGR